MTELTNARHIASTLTDAERATLIDGTGAEEGWLIHSLVPADVARLAQLHHLGLIERNPSRDQDGHDLGGGPTISGLLHAYRPTALGYAVAAALRASAKTA